MDIRVTNLRNDVDSITGSDYSDYTIISGDNLVINQNTF